MKIILSIMLLALSINAQSELLLLMDDDASWSPLDITSATLVSWYKGDVSPVTDGTDVTTWADNSGNSNDILNNAVSTDDPAVITNGLDGHKTIRFDGTSDNLRGDFAITQPITIYTVAKQITWTDDDTWWDGKIGDSMLLRQRGTTPELNIYAGTGWTADNTDLAVNTWGAIRVVYNGASSSIRIDDNEATTGNAGASNSTGFALGAIYAVNYFTNIEVAEIIIYSGTISAEDDVLIMDYLHTEYPSLP